ncbi:MAG TPA: hypothetical protein VM554_13755 [Acidisarcina sp.]|nr:hypothetical protein [Acidisarcina sp.]
MRRFQLFEILDQPWCPQAVRDGATDYLEYITRTMDPYAEMRPLMLQAIRDSGSRQVVDLCSGGGGPWLSPAWRDACSNPDWPLFVTLTDKFPSTVLQSRLSPRDKMVLALTRSIDATQVPADLCGFRTIFASFHHFSDRMASQILADAVRRGEGIATAEVTSRTFKALAIIFLVALQSLMVTPFIRPFRFSRILLTYLLPAIPLTILWDGLISCLRTRTPDELMRLTAGLEGFTWTSGYAGERRRALPVVYLIGLPIRPQGSSKLQ